MFSYLTVWYVKKKKKKLDLPKNYVASHYIKRFPYLGNANDSKLQNEVLNIVNNRAELRKYLLAKSDYGTNIQENINSVTNDRRFNNAALRNLLDEKIKEYFNHQHH